MWKKKLKIIIIIIASTISFFQCKNEKEKTILQRESIIEKEPDSLKDSDEWEVGLSLYDLKEDGSFEVSGTNKRLLLSNKNNFEITPFSPTPDESIMNYAKIQNVTVAYLDDRFRLISVETKKEIPDGCYYNVIRDEDKYFYLDSYIPIESFVASVEKGLIISLSGIVCVEDHGLIVDLFISSSFLKNSFGEENLLSILDERGFLIKVFEDDNKIANKNECEEYEANHDGVCYPNQCKNDNEESFDLNCVEEIFQNNTKNTSCDVHEFFDGNVCVSITCTKGKKLLGSRCFDLVGNDNQFDLTASIVSLKTMTTASFKAPTTRLSEADAITNARKLRAEEIAQSINTKSDLEKLNYSSFETSTKNSYYPEIIGGGTSGIFYNLKDADGNVTIGVKSSRSDNPLTKDQLDYISQLQKNGNSPFVKFFSQKKIDDDQSLQFMEPGGKNFMKQFNEQSSTSRDVLEDNTNKWITQMFTLLKNLHKNGLIHTDFKPDNMVISDSGVIKLVDFDGLTKNYTADGKSKGSPTWEAPEVLIKGKGVTTASDVYSAGVVLFQMTKKGDDANRFATEASAFEEIKDKSDPNYQLIAKMLHADPAKRPTMEEVLQEWNKINLRPARYDARRIKSL
ncbi:MAG: hypothetical protein CMP11_02655 [Zetaproteobacteria bacterium]|nr:hypothetical protein [Pseudobdellovibrionaceae bacterium]